MANNELAYLMAELIRREPEAMTDIMAKSFRMNQQEIERAKRAVNSAGQALKRYKQHAQYELALDQVSK